MHAPPAIQHITNLQSVTPANLRDALPELYRLRNLRENNDWHADDPLAQSLRLARFVGRLPRSLPEIPAETLRPALASALNRTPVHALLTFTALIHDVGKGPTFRRDADGLTRCPGHEAAGASLASAICKRFALPSAETRFVTALVGAHGEPYELYKQIKGLPPPRQKERLSAFEERHAPHLPFLLLLAWGDMTTSDLPDRRPAKYLAIRKFYEGWLKRVWGASSRKYSLDKST